MITHNGMVLQKAHSFLFFFWMSLNDVEMTPSPWLSELWCEQSPSKIACSLVTTDVSVLTKKFFKSKTFHFGDGKELTPEFCLVL